MRTSSSKSSASEIQALSADVSISPLSNLKLTGSVWESSEGVEETIAISEDAERAEEGTRYKLKLLNDSTCVGHGKNVNGDGTSVKDVVEEELDAFYKDTASDDQDEDDQVDEDEDVVFFGQPEDSEDC